MPLYNPAAAAGATTLDGLTDVVIASPVSGHGLYHDGTDWDNKHHYTFLLGPFIGNNLVGTGTAQIKLGIPTGGAVYDSFQQDIKMSHAGRVVGGMIAANTARTAGTATLAVRVAGVTTSIAACVLNATNTLSDSDFFAPASGVAFAAGDDLGAAIVTSGWTPTTADITAWLLISLDPF